MSSIFDSKSGLRSQFMQADFAALGSALSAATAYQMGTLTKGTKFLYIANLTNKHLNIALVHPDASSTVAANRLLFMEVADGEVMSLDVTATANLEIDPGTKVFVYSATGVAPGSGLFKMLCWG